MAEKEDNKINLFVVTPYQYFYEGPVSCVTIPSIDGEIGVMAGHSPLVFALKPGDGSAREQAASSQKVLGGWANIAIEYATKRYRSNLINWGMLPFTVDAAMSDSFNVGDYLLLPDIRKAVEEGKTEIEGSLCASDGQGGITGTAAVSLTLSALTEDERRIILAGSLINFYNEDAER